MNEKDIIKRCQKGEKAAFDELVRLFYPYVSKYLLKLTMNEYLTEDLTQEVFLKIIRSIDSYKIHGSAGFGTYIITAAKNCYIDYCRKNKAMFDDISEISISSNENIEETVITKLEYDDVIKYIEQLPPQQDQAIQLKYIDEFTLNEIESMTGVPAKTIKSRLHEGKKKLKKLLNFKRKE